MKFILVLALAFLILTPHEPPVVWVEIHDVSPDYGDGELLQVIQVLERHDVERVVIFVIPNHGGQKPISEYPEFAGRLRKLEAMGYEIGAHGYNHDGFEFYEGGETRERLILIASEFKSAGLSPQVFLAPQFLVKEESLPVLRDNFREVYFLNKITTKEGNHPYVFHEFTWFNLPDWVLLPVAKASYMSSRSDVYRLGVHMGQTDGGRMEFLDEFLGYTDAKNA
jgi:predicted deacetylase